MDLHQQEVDKLQNELLEWLKQHKNTEACFSLAQDKHSSNTVRANKYHKQGPSLNINHLNRVLEIDTEKMIAIVEPRVTMEQLADATLAHDLIPPVLPEFKSITVGGAINGTALESSSHRYGQFNDTCLAYEILLGDGAVIFVTPDTYPDLFYGISGAYGTLGIILSVHIKLVVAEPWVRLDYHQFDDTTSAVDFMRDLTKRGYSPEFIEGLMLDPQCTMVITGTPTKEKDLTRLDLSHYWSKWYYQIVREKVNSDVKSEVVSLRDYLFRHDRAGFWMGAYALHPLLLLRFIIECLGGCPKWLDRLLMPKNSSKYSKVGNPSLLFRLLFGWIMNSKRLYKIMHGGTEQWFADYFSIQDYYIPDHETADFADYVGRQYAIYPMWLCPMKAVKTPQFLSPHFNENGGPELYFDVGVYGLAKDMQSGASVVRDLDKLSVAIGGKKMLYGYSYYTTDEFWKIYSKENYDRLRREYFAEGAFMDIVKKVL